MDHFFECILCKQGFIGPDLLDECSVCDRSSCQSKKNALQEMMTDICNECGYIYIKRDHLGGICMRCADEQSTEATGQ